MSSRQAGIPRTLASRFFWAAGPLIVILTSIVAVGFAALLGGGIWSEHRAKRQIAQAQDAIHVGMTLDQAREATRGLGWITDPDPTTPGREAASFRADEGSSNEDYRLLIYLDQRGLIRATGLPQRTELD